MNSDRTEQPSNDEGTEDRSQAAFNLFCKWYVSITYRELGTVEARLAKPIPRVASAFVLKIAGRWLLFTAGHLIQGLKHRMSQGTLYDGWEINDAAAGGGYPPIPFAPEFERWTAIDDRDVGVDLAFVPLHPIYARQLHAAGITPPDSVWWLNETPHECSPWLIFGTPEETIQQLPSGKVLFCPTMLPVEPLKEIPTNVLAADAVLGKNLIFARVVDLPMKGTVKAVRNLDGMSGGPVIGVREPGDPDAEHSKLHIVGIQSGWLPNSRIATIYPLRGVLEVIEAHLQKEG